MGFLQGREAAYASEWERRCAREDEIVAKCNEAAEELELDFRHMAKGLLERAELLKSGGGAELDGLARDLGEISNDVDHPLHPIAPGLEDLIAERTHRLIEP